MSVPKFLSSAALCVGLIAGSTLVAALPASANSFTKPIYGGSYSYNDGQDRFCVSSRSGSTVSASLSPTVAGRGPSPSVSAQNGATRCVSLATAFEDSRYRANVVGRGEGNTDRVTEYFFS